MKNTAFGAQKLWKAYLDLIERDAGDKMDETVEKDAIASVARVIASVASGNEEFRNRVDDVMAAVRKGLTEDTAPDQHFMAAYKATRDSRMQRERPGGSSGPRTADS